MMMNDYCVNTEFYDMTKDKADMWAGGSSLQRGGGHCQIWTTYGYVCIPWMGTSICAVYRRAASGHVHDTRSYVPAVLLSLPLPVMATQSGYHMTTCNSDNFDGSLAKRNAHEQLCTWQYVCQVFKPNCVYIRHTAHGSVRCHVCTCGNILQ